MEGGRAGRGGSGFGEPRALGVWGAPPDREEPEVFPEVRDGVVESGLQPACAVVCPEQAIISGDLHDPAAFEPLADVRCAIVDYPVFETAITATTAIELGNAMGSEVVELGGRAAAINGRPLVVGVHHRNPGDESGDGAVFSKLEHGAKGARSILADEARR